MVGCRTPETVCPFCGALLDAATAIELDDRRPEPGDISICVGCSHLSAFTDTGLRPLTDAELDEAMKDEDLVDALRRLADVRRGT